MANEIIFKPKVDDQGNLIASSPIQPELAIQYLGAYESSPSQCLIYHPNGPMGNPMPIQGFYFDIDDINNIIKNLLGATTGKYEFYLGIGINDQGDHTLIAGAVEVIFHDNGTTEKERKLIHNSNNHPIYDYCNPCPPKCPNGVKIIPNQD